MNILEYACLDANCNNKLLNCYYCLKTHKCKMNLLKKIQNEVYSFFDFKSIDFLKK